MKGFLLFTSFLDHVEAFLTRVLISDMTPQVCLVLKLLPWKCKLFLYVKLSCNNITSIKTLLSSPRPPPSPRETALFYISKNHPPPPLKWNKILGPKMASSPLASLIITYWNWKPILESDLGIRNFKEEWAVLKRTSKFRYFFIVL